MYRLPDGFFRIRRPSEPPKPQPRMSLREYLSYLEPAKPPPGRSPKILLLSWENEISKEDLSLGWIFEKTLGYVGVDQIRHFEIPVTNPLREASKQPWNAVSDVLQDFKKDRDPEQLLIVYYVGGAILDNRGFMLWQPRSRQINTDGPIPTLEWSVMQVGLFYHPSKVLLLLDCFSTVDSLGLSVEIMGCGGGMTEIIAAGGAESFGLALRKALNLLGTERFSFTVIDLYEKILESYVGASRQPFRVCLLGSDEESSISIVKQGSKNDKEPEGDERVGEATRESE